MSISNTLLSIPFFLFLPLSSLLFSLNLYLSSLFPYTPVAPATPPFPTPVAVATTLSITTSLTTSSLTLAAPLPSPRGTPSTLPPRTSLPFPCSPIPNNSFFFPGTSHRAYSLQYPDPHARLEVHADPRQEGLKGGHGTQV